MAGALSERKPFLLLLVLLTAHLVLMSSRVRGGTRGTLLENAVLTVASPFLKTASWVGRGVSGVWYGYADLRAVARENRLLKDQVDLLAPKAGEAEEARREVDRLRRLLALREELQAPTVAARVIARSEASDGGVVLLDRGAGRGLRINQPVLTPQGVVGRVIEVAAGIAKVQTILDPNSGVAALLQRTRAQGIVVGGGRRGCRLEYVSELQQVEVGDVVVTSGLDRIYPRGLIIGLVTDIGEGEGLTKSVDVRPEVDFQRLEEVLVLQVPADAGRADGP